VTAQAISASTRPGHEPASSRSDARAFDSPMLSDSARSKVTQRAMRSRHRRRQFPVPLTSR
jgi:hypothetical protein